MIANIVGVAPDEPIAVAGYRAWCDAWAQDEDHTASGLVLVSFLGPHTVLQALWGQLIAGQSVELADGTILTRQTRVATQEEPGTAPDKVSTHRAVTRFPGIEQAHLVMAAEQATLQAAPGQRSYLLAAHPDGDDPRFFALWNRTVPLPARPTWAPCLWKEGLVHRCVRPLAAYGCSAWAIEPELETWSEIIQAGVEDDVLT